MAIVQTSYCMYFIDLNVSFHFLFYAITRIDVMKLRYFTKTYEKLASFRTFKKYFTKTYEKLRLKSLLYELYEQKIEPYEIPNLHPTKTTHSNL